MSKTIGERIKTFRHKRNMTRKELSNGICDESTLLRIEKGKQEPRVYIIQQLCKRLEIPVSYIIDPSEHVDIIYTSHVKKLCREFLYHEDYEALQTLIQEVEDSQESIYANEDIRRFIYWHKAILVHKKERNPLQAERELEQLLPQNKQLVSETDIGIANSLGLIYLCLDKNQDAVEILRRAKLSIDQLPFLEDKTLYVRVSYNYAHALYLGQKYEEVINIGLRILYYIQSNHLGYMVGRLHHLLSIAYEKLDILDEAENHMKKAVYIFLAESKLFLYVKALRALSEIQFMAGKTKEGLQSLRLAENKLPELPDPQNLPELIENMKNLYLSNARHRQ